MKKVSNIVAEITPSGRGAVSGIRISGPDARVIVETLFNIQLNKERFSYYIKHKIDELILCYYKTPASYTGEDVCEFFCHGNPVIVNSVIEELLSIKTYPVRVAKPGEFTKRAYLNGKIDLLQAEAVLDVINSSTQKALELNSKTLNGALSSIAQDIKRSLVEIAILTELEIDFQEETPSFFNHETVLPIVEEICLKLDRILSSFRSVSKLSGLIRILIIGRANVGKSSLFNSILEYERSIVHHLPGTTRDYIEAELFFGSFQALLTDTAGLRNEYDCDVEQKGAKRVRELLDTATLLIEVSDTDCFSSDPKKSIFVRNKADLDPIEKKVEGVFYTSAKSGDGVLELKKEIENKLGKILNIDDKRGDAFLLNKRQEQALLELKNIVTMLKRELELKNNIDIISFVNKEAITAMDKFTGAVTATDNILDELFSRFCIGK